MWKLLSVVLLAAAASLGPAPSARATLVLDLNTGGTPVPCGSCSGAGQTFGWSFSVTTGFTIDGLGVWDAGSNGIGAVAAVGLWAEGNPTALASATVTDSSTPVASGSAAGRWLFQNVASLTLGPGAYRIGMVFGPSAPLAQVSAPVVTITGVTVTGGVNGPAGSGLAYPTTPFGFPIYGPTMRLAPVPEASSLAVFGAAFAGLLASRRRRGTKA